MIFVADTCLLSYGDDPERFSVYPCSTRYIIPGFGCERGRQDD